MELQVGDSWKGELITATQVGDWYINLDDDCADSWQLRHLCPKDASTMGSEILEGKAGGCNVQLSFLNRERPQAPPNDMRCMSPVGAAQSPVPLGLARSVFLQPSLSFNALLVPAVPLPTNPAGALAWVMLGLCC